jgi:hypothetical protein
MMMMMIIIIMIIIIIIEETFEHVSTFSRTTRGEVWWWC